MRKALFFDIDGTLLTEDTHELPESAWRALERARDLGHLVFINTGRTYGNLGNLKELLPADGWLCGCGTYILSEGRELYHYSIPHEQGIRLKRDIEECGLDGILEGLEGCYGRKSSWMPEIILLKKGLDAAGTLRKETWDDDSYEFDKCYLKADALSRPQELFDRMKFMEIIDRGNDFYECVPKGHSKAAVIERVLRIYSIPLSEAYVFGDSSNDLSMFQYAKNCVAMGKHSPVLDPYVTFVTKTVEEDGIAYALEQLGIIDSSERL